MTSSKGIHLDMFKMVSNLIVLALLFYPKEAWVEDFASGFLKTVEVTLNGDEVSKLSKAFKGEKKMTLMRAHTKLVNSNSESTNHFITVQFMPFLKDGPFLLISGESDSRKDDDYLIYFRSVDYKGQNGPPEDIKHVIDFFSGLPEKRLEMTISQKVFFGLWRKKVQLKIELFDASNSFFIEAKYL